MTKVYQDLSDLPNKRGTYQVSVQFANYQEVVQVTIDYDVDCDTDTPIKNQYCYVVDDLDESCLYDACYGFKSIKAMIPEIAPRLLTIA